METQNFRRSLMRKDNFFRPDAKALEEVKTKSLDAESLLRKLRASENELTIGQTTFRLAESFGFCWGVERSIGIAQLARNKFPDKTIYLTNELIHNPDVNKKLTDQGIKFLPKTAEGRDFGLVRKGDVVILPAFGAPIEEMRHLDAIGAVIVDSTCPWVTKVWNVIEKHKKLGYTSVIHGTAAHEETEATKSIADKFLVVRDLKEAKLVDNFIKNGGDGGEFLKNFATTAYSENFDPSADLKKIGVANQTTMLKTETEEISRMLQAAVTGKHGSAAFLAFNTICDATQERQDAMKLLVQEPIDVMLVVGGFNSSNTAHLLEIAEHSENVQAAFHVDNADRILADNSVNHKKLNGPVVTTSSFLPRGPIVVGVTSGASTPDEVVEECLQKILDIKQRIFYYCVSLFLRSSK